jgi:hypothetical protein
MAENTEITVEVSGLQEKGLLQPIFTHFGRKKSIGFLSVYSGEKGTFLLRNHCSSVQGGTLLRQSSLRQISFQRDTMAIVQPLLEN